MLGRLARWLRMLGYVVSYDSKADDNSLLSDAEQNGAVLLTRDKELHLRAKARNITSVLVVGEKEEQRLGQLAKHLGISLNLDMAATKCPECGSDIREISKEESAKTVPAASLRLYNQFWRCENPNCAKTYWIGSHWKQMQHTIDKALGISGEEG